jgi:hypothetical protein
VRHNTIFYLWFFFHHFSGGFNIANTTVDQKPSTGSGFIFQSGTKPASPGGFKFGQTTVTEKNKSEAAKPDSTSAASSGFKNHLKNDEKKTRGKKLYYVSHIM